MAPIKIHAVPLKDLKQSKRKGSRKAVKLKGALSKQTTENQEALKADLSVTLTLAAVKDPEGVSKKIKAAFVSHANWLRSDNEMRELRKQITLAIYVHEDDLDKVTEIVDRLLALIQQAQKKSK